MGATGRRSITTSGAGWPTQLRYFTRDAVGQIAETTAGNGADHFAGRTGDNTLVRPSAG